MWSEIQNEGLYFYQKVLFGLNILKHKMPLHDSPNSFNAAARLIDEIFASFINMRVVTDHPFTFNNLSIHLPIGIVWVYDPSSANQLRSFLRGPVVWKSHLIAEEGRLISESVIAWNQSGVSSYSDSSSCKIAFRILKCVKIVVVCIVSFDPLLKIVLIPFDQCPALIVNTHHQIFLLATKTNLVIKIRQQNIVL